MRNRRLIITMVLAFLLAGGLPHTSLADDGSDSPSERDISRVRQKARILDQLQENRREVARIEERHFKKVRDILSPADTARYILFQIRFQQEIRKRVLQSGRDGRDRRDSRAPRDSMDRRDRDSDRGGSDRGGTGGGMGR